MSQRGIVVALSGLDSSGKTTQRDLLGEALSSLGHPPTSLWSRAGYTPGLKRVRRLLGRRRGAKRAGEPTSSKPGRYPRRASTLPNPLVRRLWLTTALLDLLWLYAVRVRVGRAFGHAMICDRYLVDCLVDFRVNFPDDRVERRWLCRLLRRLAARPDAAFCMLIPVEESVRRSRQKARYHWESEGVLASRHDAYRVACEELGVTVLDGTRPVGELADTIEKAVRCALPQRAEKCVRST